LAPTARNPNGREIFRSHSVIFSSSHRLIVSSSRLSLPVICRLSHFLSLPSSSSSPFPAFSSFLHIPDGAGCELRFLSSWRGIPRLKERVLKAEFIHIGSLDDVQNLEQVESELTNHPAGVQMEASADLD
jgi:hypothetical protein